MAQAGQKPTIPVTTVITPEPASSHPNGDAPTRKMAQASIDPPAAKRAMRSLGPMFLRENIVSPWLPAKRGIEGKEARARRKGSAGGKYFLGSRS
jgi:hypothetical protein